MRRESRYGLLLIINLLGVIYILASYAYHRPLLGLPELLAIVFWELVLAVYAMTSF